MANNPKRTIVTVFLSLAAFFLLSAFIAGPRKSVSGFSAGLLLGWLNVSLSFFFFRNYEKEKNLLAAYFIKSYLVKMPILVFAFCVAVFLVKMHVLSFMLGLGASLLFSSIAVPAYFRMFPAGMTGDRKNDANS